MGLLATTPKPLPNAPNGTGIFTNYIYIYILIYHRFFSQKNKRVCKKYHSWNIWQVCSLGNARFELKTNLKRKFLNPFGGNERHHIFHVGGERLHHPSIHPKNTRYLDFLSAKGEILGRSHQRMFLRSAVQVSTWALLRCALLAEEIFAYQKKHTNLGMNEGEFKDFGDKYVMKGEYLKYSLLPNCSQ